MSELVWQVDFISGVDIFILASPMAFSALYPGLQSSVDGWHGDLQLLLLLLLLKELLLDAGSLDMGFVWGQDRVG